MALHLHTGQLGEDLAAEWLTAQGFRILHRNWRFGHVELDVVAEKLGCLHFVEVKTRRSDKFGYPEEAVTAGKLERLQRAGAAYLEQEPHWKRIQYDILSIRLIPKGAPEFFFIEDVS